MPHPKLTEFINNNLYFNTQIKLIYEQFGYYHSETGNLINKLIKIGKIKQDETRLQGQNHPYIYDSHLSDNEKNILLSEKEPLYDDYQNLIHNQPFSGDFAESIIFLALCDSFTIHRDKLEFHLLKPQMAWLNGKTYKIDYPFMLEGEAYSLEVKNNSPQLNPESSQLSSLLNISSSINPVLANRQSTIGLKSLIMKRNGRVLDFEKLLLLNSPETKDQIQSMIDLNLKESMFPLPYITINSIQYNGREFKGEIKNLSIEELTEASNQVPKYILTKTRGLIRLLYFATLYRNAKKLPEGRRAHDMILSLLLVNFYYYILGSDNRSDIKDAYDYAERKISGPLRIYLSRNRKKIFDEFLVRIEYYNSLNFLNRYRGKCWVEDAIQPETWLRFK